LAVSKTKDDGNTIYQLLAEADETYSMLPNMRMEIEKVTLSLPEFGPRKLRRAGVGTEFFEARAHRPGVDTKAPNARLSARRGYPVVVENEAEIRQHFYLWRDSSKSTNWKSPKQTYTKKQAEEIMLLALAKHLAKADELIGVLDRSGRYRGGKAPEYLASQLVPQDDVTVVTGDMPSLGRQLPRNSTAILFSDFLMKEDELIASLDQLNGVGLKGYLVMVLDPMEIDFNGFKGHVKFNGLEGEGSKAFKRAEAMTKEYQAEIQRKIEFVKNLAEGKGFKFILQRTDEPLHKGLLAVYGLASDTPVSASKPGL